MLESEVDAAKPDEEEDDDEERYDEVDEEEEKEDDEALNVTATFGVVPVAAVGPHDEAAVEGGEPGR